MDHKPTEALIIAHPWGLQQDIGSVSHHDIQTARSTSGYRAISTAGLIFRVLTEVFRAVSSNKLGN